MRVKFKEGLAKFIDFILCKIAIFITGIRPHEKLGSLSDFTPKVYYANHTSHGDFILLWVAMPYELRKRIRPVAGSDYWEGGKIRRFLAKNVFNMLLINRKEGNPLNYIEQMSDALKTHSLIIFPEGTRKTDDDLALQPFKSGIYRLAKAKPDIKFIPIWINNINNVLPKGFYLPIPLLCELFVGDEIGYQNEAKFEFLDKVQTALKSLKKEIR